MKKFFLLFAVLSSVSLSAYEYHNEEKTSFFNIGFESERITFEEDGYPSAGGKKDQGNMYGGFARYKTYKPLGDLTRSTDTFFSLEARYLQGSSIKRTQNVPSYTNVGVVDLGNCPGGACPVLYYIPNYTPDSNKDRKQYILALEAMGGQRLIDKTNFALEGYIGLGYRRYADKAGDSQPTSGNMTYTSLYAPLGANVELKAGGWKIKGGAEGSWYFLNTISNGAAWKIYTDSVLNQNYIVNADADDCSSSGYGYKLSAEFEKDFGFAGITLSPYYRFIKMNSFGFQKFFKGMSGGGGYHYWTDSSGNPVGSKYPGNITREYGLQLSLLF